MWFFKLLDTGGVNQAGVDSNNNVKVNLPTTISQSGFVKVAGADNDKMKITAMGYPAMSIEALDFFDTIDGAAVNTNLWTQSTSTMSINQSSGFVNVNANSSTTVNAYAILSSIQTFFLTSCLPLHIHFSIQSTLFNLPANTVMEFGWGTVATNATPTDGMLVRVKAGSIYLVINNGGTEQETQICPSPFALLNQFFYDGECLCNSIKHSDVFSHVLSAAPHSFFHSINAI